MLVPMPFQGFCGVTWLLASRQVGFGWLDRVMDLDGHRDKWLLGDR